MMVALNPFGTVPFGPIIPNQHTPDERMNDCATLPVWQGLDRVISDYPYSITLQDILDHHKECCANDCIILLHF